MPEIDLSGMGDAELRDLIARIQRVLARRTLQKQIDQLTRALLEAKGVVERDSWSPPETAFEAFPKGWRVSHNGVIWKSLVHGNMSEPGTGDDWREVQGGGENLPAWVQPTDQYDGYPMGALVRYAGQHWRSLVDENVGVPGVDPGWEIVVE